VQLKLAELLKAATNKAVALMGAAVSVLGLLDNGGSR